MHFIESKSFIPNLKVVIQDCQLYIYIGWLQGYHIQE